MKKRKNLTLRSRSITTKSDKKSKVNPIKNKESEIHSTRVIRDTFSMPKRDYELINKLKLECLKQGTSMTKSEIIRAGLQVLDNMAASRLKSAVSKVEKIRTGRPLVTDGR